MSDQENQVEENESPWQTILIGLAMLAGAVFLYYTFTNLETEGGSVRMNWIVALAYKAGGKWPVAIILAILGAFTTYSGVKKMMAK